jgi:CRP-like cAMP-binding protein
VKSTLEVDCISQSLARTHLFWNLEPQELGLVSQIASEEAMTAGDVIIRAGAPESSVLVVIEGSVIVESADGKRIAEVGAGGIVGEVSLFDPLPRNETVIAKTSGSFMRFPSLDLWYMLDRNPLMALRVLNNLGRVMAARLRSAA